MAAKLHKDVVYVPRIVGGTGTLSDPYQLDPTDLVPVAYRDCPAYITNGYCSCSVGIGEDCVRGMTPDCPLGPATV